MLGTTIFIALIIISIIGVSIWIMKGNRRWNDAETVDCPVCGNQFKLIGGSFKCTQCRKKIVKTSEGQIKAV